MRAAHPDGMGRVARGEGQFGGHGEEPCRHDVAAQPDALIGLVNKRSGAPEDVARLRQCTADTHILQQLQRRFVDGFDCVIGNEAHRGKGIDELTPWHLHDVGGTAAAGAIRPHGVQAKALRRS